VLLFRFWIPLVLFNVLLWRVTTSKLFFVLWKLSTRTCFLFPRKDSASMFSRFMWWVATNK